MPLRQLVYLESESQVFLLGFSFGLNGCLHILLVHCNALVDLARVCFDAPVVLVDLLDVLDVPLGFSFVVSDEPLYLLFVLLNLGFECVLLGREIFDLGLLPCPGRLFLVQLCLEGFSFLLQSLFERLDLLLQLLNLLPVHSLAFGVLVLLRLHLGEVVLELLVFGD